VKGYRLRAIFLDKDGTLVKDIPYNVDPDRLELTPGAGAGLRLMDELGYALFVVSNQSGIAKGIFPESALHAVWQRMHFLLKAEGVSLRGVYYCPHHPDAAIPHHAIHCDCRKPQPGMLLQAAARHGIDLPSSWMIGDILDDVEAGHRAGCKSILLDNGNETEWKMTPMRHPDLTVANLYCAARAIRKMDMRLRLAPEARMEN
jgi:D-glycero-D-manno-heptose 1,7-bisphosphate phosphatase